MNELAVIFEFIGVDTLEVLLAAGTSGIFCHSALDWWWALHWCGSLLLEPQSRNVGLSSRANFWQVAELTTEYLIT